MTKGKCPLTLGGALMILAALAGAIALATKWFSSADKTVTFTLWEMQMQSILTAGTPIKAKHDDMCQTNLSAALTNYCNKIRAARAMCIVVLALGLIAAALLISNACSLQSWKIIVGGTLQVIVIGCAIAAIALGTMLLGDNTLVTSYTEGFVAVVMAVAFSSISLAMTFFGACRGGGCEGGFSFGGTGHKRMGEYDGYGKRRPGAGLPPNNAQANRQPQGFSYGAQAPAPVSYGQGVAPPAAAVGFGAPRMPPNSQQGGAPPADFGLQPAQGAQGTQMPPLPKTMDYY